MQTCRVGLFCPYTLGDLAPSSPPDAEDSVAESPDATTTTSLQWAQTCLDCSASHLSAWETKGEAKQGPLRASHLQLSVYRPGAKCAGTATVSAMDTLYGPSPIISGSPGIGALRPGPIGTGLRVHSLPCGKVPVDVRIASTCESCVPLGLMIRW